MSKKLTCPYCAGDQVYFTEKNIDKGIYGSSYDCRGIGCNKIFYEGADDFHLKIEVRKNTSGEKVAKFLNFPDENSTLSKKEIINMSKMLLIALEEFEKTKIYSCEH